MSIGSDAILPKVTALPAKARRDFRVLLRRTRLTAEILYHEMDRDRLFTQAAALTYKTLFSLLPVFVLSLLILSKISGGDGKNALDVAVKQMLFEQLNIDKMQITDDTGKTITLKDFADQIISKARDSVTNPTTGWIAFAVLAYGAVSLMIVVESTFNQMYGSPQARSWPRRIMLYWCVLTLGPIGVGISIALGHSAYSTATTIAGAGWLLSVSNVITGFMVSWFMILLLYKLIPDTRVNWRSAAIGSFLAALSWEVGKWAFGLYVQRALRNSWYGSLALLPLFMFWIYISWSVVLIGLEVTFIQQFWGLMKRRYLFLRAASTKIGGGFERMVMLSDVRWVLTLAVLVSRRFKEGKSTGVEEAAEILMLPTDVANALMGALVKAGVVRSVSKRSAQFAMARPAERVTAKELLEAARSMTGVPAELVTERGAAEAKLLAGAVDELEAVEATWAASRTLADLAG